MRLLHTSDWHLGRSFGGHALLAHQAELVDWLVDVVAAERVELVVVAGDIYDRAVPPADAVALFREALRRLRAAGARVVAVAGNHDGPERVAAYDGLTDLAGVHVRGGPARAGEVLHLEASDGPLDVVAVPFLDPVLTLPGDQPDAPSDHALGEPPEGAAGSGSRPVRPTHESVLAAALARGRAGCRGVRSLAVAHAFVSGGEPSDSERLLTVGGSGQVAASIFDGFSYVALGHLHRPQAVGVQDTVRYSGSPLPYSFSEVHPKQVVLVDLPSSGPATVTELAVPVGRRVATITGTLEHLLTDPAHEACRDCFVRAVVTDPGYVVDAKVRLRERFPHVVEIELQPDRLERPDGGGGTDRGERRTPLETALAYWRDVVGDDASGEVHDLLSEALRPELGEVTA